MIIGGTVSYFYLPGKKIRARAKERREEIERRKEIDEDE